MKRLALLALLLCGLTSSTFAGSSISPTQPTQNSALSSAVMRQQFGAAINDINGIEGIFAGTNPPARPLIYQLWANTSFAPPQLQIYDGQQWLAVASLDATNHVWLPVMGGGVATPQRRRPQARDSGIGSRNS